MHTMTQSWYLYELKDVDGIQSCYSACFDIDLDSSSEILNLVISDGHAVIALRVYTLPAKSAYKYRQTLYCSSRQMLLWLLLGVPPIG